MAVGNGGAWVGGVTGVAKKAQEEDMPVLATGKTAYEVSVLMGQAGVLPPAE